MKIRSDYVSNSSSSSFILANSEMTDHFKITKQDIVNALMDSYGRKNYDQFIKEREETVKKYPDYYGKNFVKDCGLGPFYVYDLSDEKDRRIAIKYWSSTLRGWLATNCKWYDRKKGIVKCISESSCSKHYSSIIRLIGDVYGFSEEFSSVEDIDKARCFVRSDKMNRKTGLYGKYVKIPDEVKGFIKHLHSKCGIMDNLDVLNAAASRFFVHFDENEIWMPATTVKTSKKWESEYYTYDRVCEILFKYLVKKGRINPDDPDFMEKMKIPEDQLTKWDRENGWFYQFHNGKKLTWKDLRDISLTWCMHEG